MKTIREWQQAIGAWACRKGWFEDLRPNIHIEDFDKDTKVVLSMEDLAAFASGSFSGVKLLQEYMRSDTGKEALLKGRREYVTKSILTKLALINSEVAEALEDVRKGKPIYYEEEHSTQAGAELVNTKPCGIGIELADVKIRLYELAENCGIDLEEMVERKMAYNEKRPYRHGDKLA